MQNITISEFTTDEAIAFVITNAHKPDTDKTKLSQTALKRMHPLVRRANILWKRLATNHLAEQNKRQLHISGPLRDYLLGSDAAEAKEAA